MDGLLEVGARLLHGEGMKVFADSFSQFEDACEFFQKDLLVFGLVFGVGLFWNAFDDFLEHLFALFLHPFLLV